MKHELPFEIFVSKFEGWKGGFFIVGPGLHSALLRHGTHHSQINR